LQVDDELNLVVSGGQSVLAASPASRCPMWTARSPNSPMPIDVLKSEGVVLFSNASGVYLGDARFDPCSGTATHGCLRSSDGRGP
jgi:hypothetical protein